MSKSPHDLIETVALRIRRAGQIPEVYFDQATEVVVFGSMSVGLETPSSDIDVVFIGPRVAKAKTNFLDLVVVPSEITRNTLWLASELTSHVNEYGVWLKGTPNWRREVALGSDSVKAKRRRV